MAERKFRTAVEEEPNNLEAWLGLAACYDKLRRFDLADKAYMRIRSMAGETPVVLNNIGYSFMLRGDLETAKANIMKAYKEDPDNPTIRRNVERLNRKLAKQAG